MTSKDKIKTEIIPLLPHEPGVYRYYNAKGEIIYVGKAKDLKNRVSSYFVNPERLTAKTQVLVGKIADLKYTVVESEQEAFLLENNLIKEYQPRYNILLKDSKTYPWICIKNEEFPRVFITRRIIKDGSLYFGPYSFAGYAHNLLDLIYSLFKIRTCSLSLSAEAIENEKFKECLNWHIKKCEAPCVGKISAIQYGAAIENVKELLQGNVAGLVREFKEKMREASEKMQYEEAQEFKEKMETLNAHYNKSLVVQPDLEDIDVFAIAFSEGAAFGSYMRVSKGCIIKVLSLPLKINLSADGEIFENTEKEALTRFMSNVYDILRSAGEKPNKEILVPFEPEEFSLAEYHIPQRGDKLRLLELCQKNAKAFMFQTLKQEALKNPDDKMPLSVKMLQKDLHLSAAPIHIECFDNSNLQGTNPVASCVVFKNGKPSKKDYRKFNIKTVIGANDFASMYEVVTRRYTRLVAEGEPLPRLVIVDGGRGQLDFAYKALQDMGLEEKLPIIGIAKRLEELLKPGDPNPLFLDKNSPSLKLVMQLRDEAHRFGITFHRSKRSKGQLDSELNQIKGIGEATIEKLLTHFKSVKRIKEASLEELTAVVGPHFAGIIRRLT